MARKPSVILSAAERKTAQDGIKNEVAERKLVIKDLKAAIKASEAETKRLQKMLAASEKTALGLDIRLNALKPAPKAQPAA